MATQKHYCGRTRGCGGDPKTCVACMDPTDHERDVAVTRWWLAWRAYGIKPWAIAEALMLRRAMPAFNDIPPDWEKLAREVVEQYPNTLTQLAAEN